MTNPRHIAVIDIGKSNAKLALVDLETLTEIAVLTRPNTVLPGPPWGHFDTETTWDFLLGALSALHAKHGIDAISVTTHGASIVLLDKQGQLAAPILDYEHPIPADIAKAYDAIRPPFSQTGSPRLADGLNVGAQLHYQFSQDPTLQDRTAHIVGYPQYWGHRLTGELACDVTSIGCHTDLWQPEHGTFSDLADTLGIRNKIAPVRGSDAVLGPVRPSIAQEIGLPKDIPVVVGIHDSNASLYPHLLARNAPFSVVSTGTWVVVMSVGGAIDGLDPARDTLVNVNAMGDPVPSARFMGGREYELMRGDTLMTPSSHDIVSVLSSSMMILPAIEPATGPFQGRQMRWHGPEPAIGSGERAAALSFYLSMMTATCLSLTGADGPVVVEGPFAQNSEYKTMLSAALGRPVFESDAKTGTAIGAALLFSQDRKPVSPEPQSASLAPKAWADYADKWRAIVGET